MSRKPSAVLGQEPCTGNKIGAGCLPGGFQDCGIGPGEINGRERVQHETAEEINTPCVVARHAGDVACGGMPLRLSGHLATGQKAERRAFPAGTTEAPILGICP